MIVRDMIDRAMRLNGSLGLGISPMPTTPKFNPAGTAVTLVAGDEIIYETTTTNTGALTIAVNGASAVSVKKAQGQTALVGGELHSGIYNVLTFDGTNLDTAF